MQLPTTIDTLDTEHGSWCILVFNLFVPNTHNESNSPVIPLIFSTNTLSQWSIQSIYKCKSSLHLLFTHLTHHSDDRYTLDVWNNCASILYPFPQYVNSYLLQQQKQ